MAILLRLPIFKMAEFFDCRYKGKKVKEEKKWIIKDDKHDYDEIVYWNYLSNLWPNT